MSVEQTELCPRCATNRYTPYSVLTADVGLKHLEQYPRPALSRMIDIYICSPCGTAEAMRDFTREGPVPPDEWPVEPEVILGS